MQVYIERETNPNLVRRVFRRMGNGALEYATLPDWNAHGERARWYGYACGLPSNVECVNV